jgi:hypothetical protein
MTVRRAEMRRSELPGLSGLPALKVLKMLNARHALSALRDLLVDRAPSMSAT